MMKVKHREFNLPRVRVYRATEDLNSSNLASEPLVLTTVLYRHSLS